MIYRGDHMVYTYIIYIIYYAFEKFPNKDDSKFAEKILTMMSIELQLIFQTVQIKVTSSVENFQSLFNYLKPWEQKTLESFGNFCWESADSDCIRPSGGGHYIENRPGLYSNILKFRYYRLTQDKDLVSNVLSFFHNVLISMFEYSRPANIICFSNLPWNQQPLDA